MADVFVRRTTAFLLALVAALVVVSVALCVVLFSSYNNDVPSISTHRDTERLINKPLEQIKMTPEPEKAVKVVTTISSAPKPMKEPWETNIRIPESTVPYHYDLMLYPNLQTERFTGQVMITIGVTQPMKYLVVHVKFMNITKTELKDASNNVVMIRKSFEYSPNEFWVVQPKNTLDVGNYTLSIDFNGNLKGHIVGFYMSEYVTASGEKRVIATSKFQPTDARRAFPCFDEPSFKSTFKTTLIRPTAGYVALSNMPVQNETVDSPDPGFTKVEFEKSVPMVTYLACFIVCDFDYVEVLTSDNKPFRVYSRKDQIDRTHYSRDIGVSILNYFEEYFEIKYPLPKQDMIAIPDFVSGAMEHWGLITYRETNLLFDEANSSSYNKQRVASVVSHELAHMWFGNLVTLKWWNDLWLNEGFASYVEYKGVAHYEKDWDMDHQFVVTDLQTVMSLDEILSSHPIVQTVNHPNEITEIFDSISYSKGASVLRMLDNFLGAENFRVGIRNFLRRFKYDNAVTQDLWDELQGVTDGSVNITRIMDTWTRQMGFPVLDVKTSANDKTLLEVSQRRFLIDADDKSLDDSPFNYKWDVPVTYKTNNMERQLEWLTMEKEKLVIKRPSNSKFVKLNVDEYGFYRVNYDEQLWKELITVLLTNHESLSPSDRSSLIDDSFSLAAAQQLSYDTAFQVISYLHKETHYVPWRSAFKHLNVLEDLLLNTKAYRYFRQFVLNLVDKHVERVGWEDIGSHIERRTRLLILGLACSNGHKTCIDGAVQKFQSWIKDPNYVIAANLRTTVYTYGIKGTGVAEWDTLLERYSKEMNAQEKQKMSQGLVATKEPWIAKNFLEAARNESLVRSQDLLSVVTMVGRNPSISHVAWNFIRSEWQWLIDRYGLNNRYLGRSVRSLAFKFTTNLQLKELNSFFAEYPDAGSGKRAREQGLEQVKKNIKWINQFENSLYMWLMNDTKPKKMKYVNILEQ